MPSWLFYLSLWIGPFPFILEIPVLNVNSVDPDQMPHSVASDLGLHCLPVSLFWGARHKWVKETICMKWQILFGGRGRGEEKYFKMLSAETFTQHAEW